MAGQILKPTLGLLSQGTIFSCASAEDYPDCLVHGLVITARCDIAQSKVPIFNYLPVVGEATSESLNFLNYAAHNRLYVAITRAKYQVEILGTDVRGPSRLLNPAFANNALSRAIP
jgi:hypothetical protein